MRRRPKINGLAILTLLLSLIGLRNVEAQEYPTRAVKIIINVSVGGVFDTFARALGAELQKRWNQPIVIEPRPGGNFIIAGRACAEAEPDGYTLCALTGETLVQAPLLYKQARYEPDKAFTPVSQLFYSTQLLVVRSGINIANLAELAAAAKKQSLAFAGLTLSNRLFIERFNKRNGTDVVLVPQRGGADVLNNVIAGNTAVAISSGATFLPFVQDGKVIPLAVDSSERSPLYPAVPTMAEVGYSEKIARNYLGMVVPAGTPQTIVARVREEILRIANDPEFRKRSLLEKGLEPVMSSPGDFASFLQRDTADFADIMKEAGITPQ